MTTISVYLKFPSSLHLDAGERHSDAREQYPLGHPSILSLREFLTMGLSFDLGTPINTALFIYILFSVQRIIFPSTSNPKTIPNEFKAGYSWMPKAHPPTVLFKTYNPKTLEPFNGKDGGRILLAISGTVYDVTAGRNFYGPSTRLCFLCDHNNCIAHHPLRWHVWKFCRTRCFSGHGQAIF